MVAYLSIVQYSIVRQRHYECSVRRVHAESRSHTIPNAWGIPWQLHILAVSRLIRVWHVRLESPSFVAKRLDFSLTGLCLSFDLPNEPTVMQGKVRASSARTCVGRRQNHLKFTLPFPALRLARRFSRTFSIPLLCLLMHLLAFDSQFYPRSYTLRAKRQH